MRITEAFARPERVWLCGYCGEPHNSAALDPVCYRCGQPREVTVPVKSIRLEAAAR